MEQAPFRKAVAHVPLWLRRIPEQIKPFIEQKTFERYLEGFWVYKFPFENYGLGNPFSEKHEQTSLRHFSQNGADRRPES